MGKGFDGMSYSRRKYIRGIPQSKITKFTMGKTSVSYTHRMSLVSLESKSVDHRALEAMRVAVNKVLMDKLGESGYGMKVLTYPHEITREHKFMGFAGADRLSEGMRAAFGKPAGRAARVNKNQAIVVVEVNENAVDVAKIALSQGLSKLPIDGRIVIERLEQAESEARSEA
jgi:large subunit ribosomal protein L10e